MLADVCSDMRMLITWGSLIMQKIAISGGDGCVLQLEEEEKTKHLLYDLKSGDLASAS